MKVSYCSLGCKVNEYESMAIINDFLNHGYELVGFNQHSDVYIINTCTVTAVSDAKSRKMIRRAVKGNPDAVVAVMGCFAQLHPDEVKKIPGVDVLIGTTERQRLFGLVSAALVDKSPQFAITDVKKEKTYEELKIERFANKSRGFVKIEDGCNNFCSYCAIPYARGRVRSRKSEDVIAEVQLLTDQGIKEIVLAGINSGAYGEDLGIFDLGDLLIELVQKVRNLGRIRVSSIEATDITPKLLQAIKTISAHVCDHFHIPLQGGCNETLKRMARKYDLEYYSDKIAQIRSIFPSVNITTDIMTGFSGETADDFESTLKFVDSMDFGETHIFPYSRRIGTAAFNFPDPVDEMTKRYRVNELLALNQKKALEYRQKFEGQVLQVIVERNRMGLAFGHSPNYLEIEFPSQTAKKNDLVKVIIVKAGYPVATAKEAAHV